MVYHLEASNKNNFRSLHIACPVDIIHVEYTITSKIENIISFIPDIRNTTVIRNIDNDLSINLKIQMVIDFIAVIVFIITAGE